MSQNLIYAMWLGFAIYVVTMAIILFEETNGETEE